ncbi:hypothetical protein JB92DRAFT_3126105 [Gautieria morchelliformis]|nr:hypothetical protein JB92DRAFT_3126105 [Gautieria morchelliformis]
MTSDTTVKHYHGPGREAEFVLIIFSDFNVENVTKLCSEVGPGGPSLTMQPHLRPTVRTFKALLLLRTLNPPRHGSNTQEAYSALARKINIAPGDRAAASKEARESLQSDNAGLDSRRVKATGDHICNVRPDWEALVTKRILPNGHDDRAKEGMGSISRNNGRRVLSPSLQRCCDGRAIPKLVGSSIGSHGRRC